MTSMQSEEVPPPIQLRNFIGEKLQEGFNEQSAGLGAQIVTDWIVVAEVHGGDGPVLRLVDSGLPLWRQIGLVEFARMDAANDMMLLTAGNIENDDEE